MEKCSELQGAEDAIRELKENLVDMQWRKNVAEKQLAEAKGTLRAIAMDTVKNPMIAAHNRLIKMEGAG